MKTLPLSPQVGDLKLETIGPAVIEGLRLTGYHVTHKANFSRITQYGYSLKANPGFGNVWGPGLYLALDEDTAQFYSDLLAPNSAVLLYEFTATKTLVLNYHVGRAPYQQALDALIDAKASQGLDWAKAYAQVINDWAGYDKNKSKLDLMQSVADYLWSLAFDSLVVLDYTDDPIDAGGHQVVVFDPKKANLV